MASVSLGPLHLFSVQRYLTTLEFKASVSYASPPQCKINNRLYNYFIYRLVVALESKLSPQLQRTMIAVSCNH